MDIENITVVSRVSNRVQVHRLVSRETAVSKVMVMIMIALKGATRDFYSHLTAPRTASNTYAQVARAQSSANRAQHIERLSRVTCHVPRGTKGQINYQV